MGKRIVLAVLWGSCGWMWAAIAHVFLGTPEISAIVGAAALLIAFVVLAPRPRQAAGQAASAPDAPRSLDAAQPHR